MFLKKLSKALNIPVSFKLKILNILMDRPSNKNDNFNLKRVDVDIYGSKSSV
jgi:hypothetical protein